MSDKPLEYMSPEEIIGLMDDADSRAMDAVRGARSSIAEAAECAASAIGRGGRLIYVGAGTSGRLGVLDASECPPTFSSKPGQVVGIIAGGDAALANAVEGAEDDIDNGMSEMARLNVRPEDMVLGISASGSAPFVMGALEEALSRGADCWLLSCSGKQGDVPGDVRTITLDTGKEVIQGSTRLAAGTATKLVLNRITTTAFVMLGKVYGDLMVDVAPTNAKLVKRAAGIISSIASCPEDEALEALRASGDRTKTAALMKARGLSPDEAQRLLDECGGFLRKALEGRCD